MKQPRGVLCATVGAALFCAAFLVPASVRGQGDLLPAPGTIKPAPVPAAPAAPRPAVDPNAVEKAAVTTLVAEIIDQQAKMALNQKTIDEKLAVIAENLRIARIYVSRSK